MTCPQHLIGDDTRKSGAEQRVTSRLFQKTADHQIDVSGIRVDALQRQNVRFPHDVDEIDKVSDVSETAQFPVVHVAGKAVIPASLQVETEHVEAEFAVGVELID